MIDRTGAAALIPEEVATDIVKAVQYESVSMRRFRSVRMGRKQQRMPVLSVLPQASWVNGDTGLKSVTDASWANKYLTAEPIACIIPIPEDVLDDADFDLWAEVKPLAVQAIARKIDSATFLNDVSRPSSWPTPIQLGCTAAGHSVTRGTAAVTAGGIATDISNAMGFVEADGFVPSADIAVPDFKARVRNARDADGQRLMDSSADANSIFGVPIDFTLAGLWGSSTGDPEFFTGDFSQAIMGIRTDITAKVLTESTLYDDNGDVLFALAQQDMVAVRLVTRVAFQVPNPINYYNVNSSTRYPFAMVVRP